MDFHQQRREGEDGGIAENCGKKATASARRVETKRGVTLLEAEKAIHARPRIGRADEDTRDAALTTSVFHKMDEEDPSLYDIKVWTAIERDDRRNNARLWSRVDVDHTKFFVGWKGGGDSGLYRTFDVLQNASQGTTRPSGRTEHWMWYTRRFASWWFLSKSTSSVLFSRTPEGSRELRLP